MKSDFNEKFYISKNIIFNYMKLYNINLEYGFYVIYINKNKCPNITISFNYNAYIHEEQENIFKMVFDDLLNGNYKIHLFNNINEVLSQLKDYCHKYFKEFKKKSLQLSLFDI